MKMNTRSSARQTHNEISLNSKYQDSKVNCNTRQAREPVLVLSDDSDDDSKVKDKKSRRRVAKSKSTSSDGDDSDDDDSDDDDSDDGCRTKQAPLESKKEQRQDKLLQNRTRKRVTRAGVFIDDCSDECGSVDNQNQTLSTPRKQRLRHSDCDINCASPPKQKRTTNEDVPRTPKHNKIEQNEVQTPSRLFIKLTLTSPTHTNGIVEKGKSNRKELFTDNEESSFAENGGQCSGKNVKTASFYRSARRALHTSYSTDMPGREKELKELKEFIKTHIENKTSGSLYISGPPGTGKTASLNLILQDENICSELRKVYINCTAIKSATAIYSRIAKELDIKTTGKVEKDALIAVENYLKKQSKMILLVLDEIDQLENKNQSILYTIFEWPSKPNSRLILVGIANALDLTDRKLCRLQGHYKLKPKLMHFAPYTKQQILQIFTTRLKSADVLDVFSPAALQILAGKFAAGSGDIRRALDIGRRAVELVDQSNGEDVLKPVENLASGLVDKESKPKSVEVSQVVNVLNHVYGTSQNLIDETDNTFPLQQKIIICSLVLMLKKARNKDVTVGKLHEVYKRVCTKRNILNVDQAEFVGLCSLIETRGIIRVTRKKEPRLNKVNLEWDEEEVASALRDKQLMSTILQDESCLGKM